MDSQELKKEKSIKITTQNKYLIQKNIKKKYLMNLI